MRRAALWLAVALSITAPGALAQTPCKDCTPRTAAHSPRQSPPPSRHSSAPRAARPQAARASAVKPRRASGSEARTAVELGATDITGNKELPKVMVIVPWKRAGANGEVIEPPDTLVDEVLAPVDREVFQRRIRYFRELHPAAGRTGAGEMAQDGDRH